MALGNYESYMRGFEKKLLKVETKMNAKPERAEIRQYLIEYRNRQEMLSKDYKAATEHAMMEDGTVASDEKLAAATAATLAAAATARNHSAHETEKEVEYVIGTEIYYGSLVSLQAKHGGFLSYLDKKSIKASAHKKLPHAKFIIMKSSDLTDKNVARYGDAVWLQAGQHEVLGALFSGQITEGQGRSIRPTLISSRRSNMFKAQQYGRWIIINRKDPLGAVGKPVKHHDDIMLEQEWYYLASRTPSDSFMFNIEDKSKNATVQRSHKREEDRNGEATQEEALGQSRLQQQSVAEEGGRAASHKKAQEKLREYEEQRELNKIDFFKTGEECCWTLVLAGLDNTRGSRDADRAELLSNATDQIKESKENRLQAAKKLLNPLIATIPEHLQPEALRTSLLAHKQTNYTTQKSYIDKFAKLSAKGFMNQPSIQFIEKLYGTDSIIYKKKQEVQLLRDAQIGIEKPPIEYHDIITHNRLDIANTKYWDKAQQLLVSTDTWSSLDHAMHKFYEIDFHKKVRAAKILQRMMRRYMERVWRFDREFEKRDKEILVQYHKNILSQRHAIVEDVDATDPHHSTSGTGHTAMQQLRNRSYSTTDLNKTVDAHSQVLAEGAHSRSLEQIRQMHRREQQGIAEGQEEDDDEAALDPHDKNKVIPDIFITTADDHVKILQIKEMEKDILRDVKGKRYGIEFNGKPNNPVVSGDPFGSPIHPPKRIPERRLTSATFARKPLDLNSYKSKASNNTAADSAERPSTAPLPATLSAKELYRLQKEKEKQQILSDAKAKLGYSATNTVGLPAEVFEDFIEPVNLHTGIKFLRTRNMAADYNDVSMKRRSRPSTASLNPAAIHTAVSSSLNFEPGFFNETKNRPSSSHPLRSSTTKIPGVRIDLQQEMRDLRAKRPMSSPHVKRGEN